MGFSKKDTSAVKGVAILMMLYHHLFLDPSRYEGFTVDFSPLGEEKSLIIAQFFKICVAIFVFLSGYGITISLKRIDKNDKLAYKKQIGKRMFSLMSGFWFIYVICFILALVFDKSILTKGYAANNIFNSIWFIFVDFMGLAKLFSTPTIIGTWWYMSLAIIIVVAMPLFYKFYEKYGTVALLVSSMVLCGIFEDKNYDMVRWMFTLCLGIVFADKSLLTRIKAFRIVKKIKVVDYLIKLVLYTAIMIASIYARTYADWTVSYLRDGIIPVIVIIWCYTILFEIKPVYVVLDFLGKYSTNIFMSHTLLRGYLLKDFIYSRQHFLIIYLTLIVLSLAFAIVIDLLKKATQYDRLCKFVTNKILNYKIEEKVLDK